MTELFGVDDFGSVPSRSTGPVERVSVGDFAPVGRIPGDPGFRAFINQAYEAGHITELERAQRRKEHWLIIRGRRTATERETLADLAAEFGLEEPVAEIVAELDAAEASPAEEGEPVIFRGSSHEEVMDLRDDDEPPPDDAPPAWAAGWAEPSQDGARPNDVDLLGQNYTDLGNARRFTALHKGKFLYSRADHEWLEWRDGRWRRDISGAAERAAKAVVDRVWEELVALDGDERHKAAKFAAASEAGSRIREMLKLAESELDFVVLPELLDADPWLLSCANGTLDLRTGALRPADPADLISRGTEVSYAPDAPRARWERFLDEVFAGDAELIAFVKRAYGSCLTGDTRDRMLMIQWGARFNGKSTLNRVFARVLGPDLAQVAPVRVVMRSKGSDIPNEIARLARVRFVQIAETADDRKLNEAQVKMLTGRDRIVARFLNKEWFEFDPEFKLVLYTNYKPKIDGSDGAIWDRVKLIPFNVSFADREDKELGTKLTDELEGILAWGVEGCLEWQRDGLGSCDAVEQATRAYRKENDTFGGFLRDRCELGDEYMVAKPALRAACEAYFRDEGADPLNAVAVGHALGRLGMTEVKRGGQKLYRGLRLLEEER